jgi:hypothetical protein
MGFALMQLHGRHHSQGMTNGRQPPASDKFSSKERFKRIQREVTRFYYLPATFMMYGRKTIPAANLVGRQEEIWTISAHWS